MDVSSLAHKTLIAALMSVLVVFSNAAQQKGTMTDARDSKNYKTIQIGEQVWMAENLNYKTPNSYCYEDKESNCSKFGRLYEWEAALVACPAGWHLPSKTEFKILLDFTGKIDNGRNLKSKKGWNKGGNGIDAFGFSALPAGSGAYVPKNFWKWSYFEKGNETYFRSSTEFDYPEIDYTSAYCMNMISQSDGAFLGRCGKTKEGFSIRCVKNSTGKLAMVSNAPPQKGILIDTRNAKEYKTVKIGNQTWMAENLNYKTEDSYCYEDKESNCKKYGRYYRWNAANFACPAGWHLPSKAEFETLVNAVGGESVAGLKLKSKTDWNDNRKGTDAFEFSALPAGDRNDEGGYDDVGDIAFFWSSTQDDSHTGYYMGLGNGDDSALLIDEMYNGFSVRCLKD